jgi:hypothetical protein
VPERLTRVLLGQPRDPLSRETRQKIALVAFLAWVGLGADGLSSANYGPAEAYIGLQGRPDLGLFVAAATILTVFIISLGYNQVIELFPTGGGGYKVASRLLGPHAGLVAGCALIVDYVLTVVISVAAGVDALISLLPLVPWTVKAAAGALAIGLLVWLNLRGVKETVLVLMPVFLGFLITHGGLVVVGVAAHEGGMADQVTTSVNALTDFAGQSGWLVVLGFLLRAYSLGAGTYTGIEAISNNVHILAEPRVRTGKLAMFYMAASLGGLSAGLMVLYLLWDLVPVPGETLNATVFRTVLSDPGVYGGILAGPLLAVTLGFAAALLLIAANTGFLGGPAVLANMGRWIVGFRIS